MSTESLMLSNHLILCCPSPPSFSLSQHQGLFQWVSSSHKVAKVLEFQLQHQSLQWILRTDLLYDGLVGSPCSPRDSHKSSPTPQFKSHQMPSPLQPWETDGRSWGQAGLFTFSSQCALLMFHDFLFLLPQHCILKILNQRSWVYSTKKTQTPSSRFTFACFFRAIWKGSGLGTHVHPWRIHVNVWQNQYSIVK